MSVNFSGSSPNLKLQGNVRAIDGDQDGEFSSFYRAHARFVWRALRRLGIDEDNVEDTAQETFIIAHRKWSAFDGQHPRAWLAAIARRIASDHRKREDRRQDSVRDSRDDVALARSAHTEPEALESRKAAADLLHRLLATLDAPNREVFVLAELEGMSMREVALATDLNPNTAYARLRSAKVQMKAEYARVIARDKWRIS